MDTIKYAVIDGKIAGGGSCSTKAELVEKLAKYIYASSGKSYELAIKEA
jgi:hypothetical protein